MCIVVNKYKSPFDVYIGRGSKWGNPYVINESIGMTREKVIELYDEYLWSQIKNCEISIAELQELDGKRLGCFCKPKPCHGDVIQEAVNWALKQPVPKIEF